MMALILLLPTESIAAREKGPQQIRVCDLSGCRTQASDAVTLSPDDQARAAALDNDTYQGEPIEPLRARADRDDAIAAYKLGIALQYGAGGRPHDDAGAARYYAIAADQGHAWAAYRLGALLMTGRVKHDAARATQLYFAAAKAGQPLAANEVGLAYMRGASLPQDNVQAVKWLTVAANGGVPAAKYNLGLIYMRGMAGGQDLEKGWRWMLDAARSGRKEAQKIVGETYMTGLNSIQQDLDEAARWLEPLARSGDKDAIRWMHDINYTREENRQFAMRMAEHAAATMEAIAGAVLANALAPAPSFYVVD